MSRPDGEAQVERLEGAAPQLWAALADGSTIGAAASLVAGANRQPTTEVADAALELARQLVDAGLARPR